MQIYKSTINKEKKEREKLQADRFMNSWIYKCKYITRFFTRDRRNIGACLH